jgi:hypothetical protein
MERNAKGAIVAALAALGLGLATLGLAGCDRGAGDTTVGQKLDRAVEKTQQSLTDASEKTRETLRENAPKVERKLSAAGEKIEEATEKTVERTREALREHSGNSLERGAEPAAPAPGTGAR